MTEMITPTAIDAFVRIEYVKVVGRHRRDLGDVASLAHSIEDVGLLNPLTLTRDGRLIAGQRRLEACRLLRWREVPVRFADNLDDAAKLLHAERDENTCRKDMLPSELVALGKALEEFERPRAAARKAAHGGTAPGRSANTELHEKTSVPGSTDGIVAAALGIGSTTYWRAKKVVEAAASPDATEEARQALADMDATGNVSAALRTITGPAPAPAVSAPIVSARQFGTASERYDQIREFAASGHSSTQIADLLGYSGAETVRDIARKQGIKIPADEAMGRGRKTIDSNRIVRETIHDLAELQTALNLVTYDELDRSEIEDWTNSLTASIRILNRLNKRLRELAP